MERRKPLHRPTTLVDTAAILLGLGLAACIMTGDQQGIPAHPTPRATPDTAADVRMSVAAGGAGTSLSDYATSLAAKASSPDVRRIATHWLQMVEATHDADLSKADSRQDALLHVLIGMLLAVERGDIGVEAMGSNLLLLGDMAEKSSRDCLDEHKRLTAIPELALPGAKVGPNPWRLP